MVKIRVVIITVSDTCFENDKLEDLSGLYLKQAVNNDKYDFIDKVIVPDEEPEIREKIKFYVDDYLCDVLILTGGTGFTDRDVTPEAAKFLLEKEAPGIQIALMTESLKNTKFAMLSRLVCGIRKKTLIMTFPGSLNACKECFEVVEPVLEHAVDQLQSNILSIQNLHNDKRLLKSKAKVPSVLERYNNLPKTKFTYNDAFNFMITVCAKKPKEIVDVDIVEGDNFGYYNVENISSPMHLPPFNASIKDGYAMKSSEGKEDRITMPLNLSAGHYSEGTLKPLHCYKISTGSYVPNDADCVVKIEDTEFLENIGSEYKIRIRKNPKSGRDIKMIGSDILEDEFLIEKNTLLTIDNFGLLASVGISKVKAFAKPKVSILSSGDELLTPGMDKWRLPCIYDSNRTILKCLLKTNHFNKIRDLGIVKDDIDLLYGKMVEAFDSSDVLITSGGVSVGEKDFFKLVLLADFDAKIHFSRVKIKPGMPFVFATCVHKGKTKYFFGLPGNPVSTFVICSLYVIPALKCMSGCKFPIRNLRYELLDAHKSLNVVLDDELGFANFARDGRPEFVRCLVKFEDINFMNLNYGLPKAYLINQHQQSSKLLSLKGANALVLINPENRTKFCRAVILNKPF